MGGGNTVRVYQLTKGCAFEKMGTRYVVVDIGAWGIKVRWQDKKINPEGRRERGLSNILGRWSQEKVLLLEGSADNEIKLTDRFFN